MRARTIYNKRAFCFDFDDTLVTTNAKVSVFKDGRKIRSLTPAEYNFYEPVEGETTDMSDFEDPRLIMQAKKGKMWNMLSNVYMGKRLHYTDSDIFILTARNEKAQLPIHNFLRRNNIDIPLDQIICISRSDGRHIDIADEKERILRLIDAEYDQLMFFDDSLDNIEGANVIPGIKTRLVEKTKTI